MRYNVAIMIDKGNEIKIGHYVKQLEGHKSFTPYSFPPKNILLLNPKFYKKNEEAIRLIGKLDGITKLLPDKDFFLLMFIKKDAAYSSQIEGTQATLQDAIAVPVTEERSGISSDVDDIIHYINAINYGIKRVKELPLSLRLICEIHEKLMNQARATQHAYPGEFRKGQNWIGGKNPNDAVFVPPAVDDMQKALNDLEEFIHKEDQIPTLIKAALLHAQFETIHPFTDGNGRTGRMLNALYLYHTGLLDIPVMYLSSYFKKYQKLYYQKLNSYHDEDSKIEEWIEFFLEGIIEIAESSIETCAKITDLRERDFAKMHKLGAKSAEVTLEITRQLFKQPIIGVAEIMKWTKYSKQGSYKIIERLISLGILKPLGVTKYGQKYVYADYYSLFDENFS